MSWLRFNPLLDKGLRGWENGPAGCKNEVYRPEFLALLDEPMLPDPNGARTFLSASRW